MNKQGDFSMKQRHTRLQRTTGLSNRCYALVKWLSKKEKRPLTSEIELLAEEDCKRKGYGVPTDEELFKSLEVQ